MPTIYSVHGCQDIPQNGTVVGNFMFISIAANISVPATITTIPVL